MAHDSTWKPGLDKGFDFVAVEGTPEGLMVDVVVVDVDVVVVVAAP